MLRPIAYPLVDWPIYIELTKRALGISPARGLDQDHIPLHDPAAFIATLDMENKPLEALRTHDSSIFHHMCMTCAGIIHEDLVHKIITRLPCGVLIYPSITGKGDKYIIITATMDKWINAILQSCQGNTDDDLRKVMSNLFEVMMSSTFKEVFSKYKRTKLPDGTYVLGDGQWTLDS